MLVDCDIDSIYDIVDGMMKLNLINELDCFLLNYDRESSIDVLIALLTASLPAASRLKNRKHIADKVKLHKNYQEGLLKGLV